MVFSHFSPGQKKCDTSSALWVGTASPAAYAVPMGLEEEPQIVEQVEKVPTILYILKQKVDIPVPRRGADGGL